MSAVASLRILLPLALLVLLATTLPAAPAAGHASSVVPHATLSSDGHEVRIEWTAAPDDGADVLVAAGLLPEEAMYAYLDGPVEDQPSDEEIHELSRSPRLRAYLEQHVGVTQDGRACDGRAEPAEHFVYDGATFVFECPEPVEHARVHISILHDRDPEYRTYSVDGTIQTELHTSEAPEHLWDFTLAAESGGGSDRRVLLLALAGVVLVAGGAWRLLGTRER